jgi:hypothetical protein
MVEKMIKTFRALLADGGQDRIRLQTIKGKVGYRIVKFQIFPTNGGATVDSNLKIWKVSDESASSTIDFSNSNLLAAAIYYNGTYEIDHTVVFDNEVFNQDIYIQHHEQLGSEPTNYYLELEVIPLDDTGAEYTTLKDMRLS